MPKPKRHARDFYDGNAYVQPEWYGAVADGRDVAAALLAALNTGEIVDGGGRTYGITGALALPANSYLRNITLKQLAPAASQSVITLYSNGVSNLTLKSVKVDRNGSGLNAGTNAAPNAALDTARGMAFTGGTGHHFEDLEVFGNDSGTGILFNGLDHSSKIIRPHVHDMFAVVAAATDDCVQGITLESCTGVVVVSPIVRNLGWKNAAPDAVSYKNSRCITLNGSPNVSVVSPRVSFAGQGIDISGGLGSGNLDVIVRDPYVTDMDTWGVKYANLTKRAKTFGGVSVRCGLGGFVNSANWDTAVSNLDANVFNDCEALDCGLGVGTNGGFIQINGSRTHKVPTKFLRCNAYDRRGTPTMTYAFYSELVAAVDKWDQALDCTQFGATNASPFFGVVRQNRFAHTMRQQSSRNLTSTTAAQAIFDPAFDSFTAEANTVYEFEGLVDLDNLSGSSGTFSFGFGGTATFTNIKWSTVAFKVNSISTPAAPEFATAAAATVIPVVSANTNQKGVIRIFGVAAVNAAGTIIPQTAMSVAAVGAIAANSRFSFRVSGTNNATTAGAIS